MSTIQDESLMRAAFAPARTLEPSKADVADVIARVTTPVRRRVLRDRSSSWRRLAVPGLATLALLAGGAYTFPPARAAINDVAGTVAGTSSRGWLGGNSTDAPGRPLDANEQAPDYFHDQRYARDPRVIAEADGYKLYAALQPDGSVEFDLGNTGVGLGGYVASDFSDSALYVLGPGSMQNADEQGHVPLFGITARSVTSVELAYDSGPPLRVDGVDGGFVLLAEPSRGPHEVVAFDARGTVIGRQLVDESPHYGPRIDWQQYGPPSPRVPSQCQPGAAGLNPTQPCPSESPTATPGAPAPPVLGRSR